MERISHQAGFTLIEVVMATVILMLALVPMCGLCSQASATLQRASDAAYGQQLAAGKLEELIADTPSLPGSGSEDVTAQPPFPAYSLEHVISSDGEVTLYVVQISWQRMGREHQFSLAAETPTD